MINSIYTHKEIFLREIISNASDAMDKLAYQALTDEKVGLNRDDFAVSIQRDPKHGILTVSDNGIGMSKEEMEENLGTICKSGSLDFKEKMDKQETIDIIGQFGVGFYSALWWPTGDSDFPAVRLRGGLDVAVQRCRRIHHAACPTGGRRYRRHHEAEG